MSFCYWCRLYQMHIHGPWRTRVKSPLDKSERLFPLIFALTWGIPWHDKGSGYRCLPLMWGCACEATFQFKGSGCWEQVSICFKCSRRRFISRLLDRSRVSTFSRDKHPSKPAEAATRSFCQDCSLLPRCDGVDRVPTVSSSWCHSPTAPRRVTKLFHRGDRRSRVRFTHTRGCLAGCHLSLCDLTKWHESCMCSLSQRCKAPEVWSIPLSQSRPANMFASLQTRLLFHSNTSVSDRIDSPDKNVHRCIWNACLARSSELPLAVWLWFSHRKENVAVTNGP